MNHIFNTQRKARKTEKLDWFVNYTNDPSSGRTTETSRFDTRREAREFAQGKAGYITRQSDGGRDFAPDASSTQFVEYFGDFQPSAQEAQTIERITGEAAPEAPARRTQPDATQEWVV